MLSAFLQLSGQAFSVEQVAGRQLFKRAATAEQVAAMIVFLLSEDGSFITGESYPVSGGWDI